MCESRHGRVHNTETHAIRAALLCSARLCWRAAAAAPAKGKENKLMDYLLNVIRAIIDMLPGRCKTISSIPPPRLSPHPPPLLFSASASRALFQCLPNIQQAPGDRPLPSSPLPSPRLPFLPCPPPHRPPGPGGETVTATVTDGELLNVSTHSA